MIWWYIKKRLSLFYGWMVLIFLAWTILWRDLLFYQVRKTAEEAGLRGKHLKFVFFYMISLKCLLEFQLELLVQQLELKGRDPGWRFDLGIVKEQMEFKCIRLGKIFSEAQLHGDCKINRVRVQVLDSISYERTIWQRRAWTQWSTFGFKP